MPLTAKPRSDRAGTRSVVPRHLCTPTYGGIEERLIEKFLRKVLYPRNAYVRGCLVPPGGLLRFLGMRHPSGDRLPYICSMNELAASADRSPRCTYRAAQGRPPTASSAPTLGPWSTAASTWSGIARSKSTARTLRRVFSLADPPTRRLPSPRGDHHR